MKHPLTEPFRFALLANCHGCQPETPDVFRVLVGGCHRPNGGFPRRTGDVSGCLPRRWRFEAFLGLGFFSLVLWGEFCFSYSSFIVGLMMRLLGMEYEVMQVSICHCGV